MQPVALISPHYLRSLARAGGALQVDGPALAALADLIDAAGQLAERPRPGMLLTQAVAVADAVRTVRRTGVTLR